jgi:hypothetical protein
MTRPRASFAMFALLAAVAAAQETAPSIKYGSDRSSKTWIQTPKGDIAVDEGVAWQGVKVYLSLLWDLIATDEATGKFLWTANVGAFWNEIGFKEVETGAGAKTWVVELRPGARTRAGRDLRQYHDLRTGKVIPGPVEIPAGQVIEVRHWTGRRCAASTPLRRLVGSEADWKTSVLDVLFPDGQGAPNFGAIDFEKNVVLVIAMGEIENCNGIDATAWEDDRRILVRLAERWFQTSGPNGGGQTVRPFGIFVLPKRDPFKVVIVERNQQRLIGGPQIWKETHRFAAPGDAPAESRPAKQSAR